MRVQKQLYILAALLFVVTLLPAEGRAQVEPARQQREAKYLVAYGVSNLPVWRVHGNENPEFDATLLIAYLKENACPGAWDETTHIAASPQDARILVLQTPTNHKKISAVLTRLSAFAGNEQTFSRKLGNARFSNQHVLLLVGDVNYSSTHQFFTAYFDEEDKNLQSALANYFIHGARRDQNQLLERLQLDVPRLGEALFAIVNPNGKVVASTAFDRLAGDGNLDRSLLAEFLNAHRPLFPDANGEIDSALAEAARSDRRVLVQVSGPNCGPCILLSRYLESHKELLARDYVYVKLDSRMSNAAEVIGQLRGNANGPIPWMAILSAEGQKLITSDSKEGNIGYPQSKHSRAHLEHMLRTTSQRLSDAELDKIMNGLADRSAVEEPK